MACGKHFAGLLAIFTDLLFQRIKSVKFLFRPNKIYQRNIQRAAINIIGKIK